MKKLITVISTSLLLMACQTTTNHQAIASKKSDFDLYGICTRDLQKSDFLNSPCDAYMRGFASGYYSTSYNLLGALDQKTQLAVSKSFERLHANDFSTRDLAVTYVTYTEKGLKNSSAWQHADFSSAFLLHYLFGDLKHLINKDMERSNGTN